MEDLERFLEALKKARLKAKLIEVKNWKKGEPPIQKVYGAIICQRDRLGFFYHDHRLNLIFAKMDKVHGKTRFNNKNVVCLSAKRGNLQVFCKSRNKTPTGLNCAYHNITALATTRIRDKKFKLQPDEDFPTTINPVKEVISREVLWKMYKLIRTFCEVEGIPFRKIKKKDINKSLDFIRILSESVKEAAYPGLRHIKVSSNAGVEGVPLFLSESINTEVSREQVYRSLFGKNNSKVLKKAIWQEGLTSQQYSFVKAFGYRFNRGELEHVVTSKKYELNESVRGIRLHRLRKFFSHFSNTRLFKLFEGGDRRETMHIRDTLRQWNEFPDKFIIPDKPKNFQELHDDLSRQYRRMQDADYEFNIPKKLKPLDGVPAGENTIVIPKTRHELLNWGEILRNCIASYHSRFHKGDTYLLGVQDKDGEILYNIEINPLRSTISQFYGRGNSRVAPEEQLPVLEVLHKHEMIGGGEVELAKKQALVQEEGRRLDEAQQLFA